MISLCNCNKTSPSPFQAALETLKYSALLACASLSNWSVGVSPCCKTARIPSLANFFISQNFKVFSDTRTSAVSLSLMSFVNASFLAFRRGRSSLESCFNAESFLALKYTKAFGSAGSECNKSMILLADVVKAMVAGVRAGAGAEEVVWVRDRVERDLSRNSVIA